MADNYLSTSGINSLVTSYTYNMQERQINPLNMKKNKYLDLNTAWGDLSSKISSLKTIVNDLKLASTENIFNTKTADSSNTSFITATPSKSASVGAYTMRVSQLAKGDLLLSNTMASATAVTDKAGDHTFRVTSGDHYADVKVTLTGAETNKSIMEKLTEAINVDKAEITSSAVNAASTFTGAGSFVVDLNGTETTLDYDFSAGKTYSEAIDSVVENINKKISGLTAEKVIEGGNVKLKITGNNSSQYITIKQSSDTGGLFGAANLNIDVSGQKGGAGIVSPTFFAPSSGNSKFSFTAVNSGYDNRLQLSETSGSVLSFMGWNSSLLSSRTITPDNDSAGFMYTVNSSTDNQLNAKYVLNGINIQSNSNTITDVVGGVSLTLKGAMAATDGDVSINVKNDTTAIKAKLQEFVTKYNDVYKYIKSRSVSEKDSRGVFVSDSTSNALLSSLRNIATSQVAGIPQGNLDYLSKIGITFSPDTGLTVSDDTKLTDSINNKPLQISEMFNSTNGIAARLFTETDRYVGSSGVISKLRSTYTNNIKYISDKVTTTQRNIDKSATVLRNQYNRLLTQLAALYTTSSTFSSMSGSTF